MVENFGQGETWTSVKLGEKVGRGTHDKSGLAPFI